MAKEAQQTYIRQYWQQLEVWKDEINDLDNVRIPKTISMIPQDVKTILEIGCGNGLLSNRIATQYEVIGLDISKLALGFVKAKRVLASSDHVPLQNNSVDVVLCADVLEHLPDQVLVHTLSEIKRVSKKYILVGVPFRERFQTAYVKCNACGHVFNRYGHVHKFNCLKLDRLFHDWDPINTAFVGGPRKYYNSLLLFVHQRLGGGLMVVGPMPYAQHAAIHRLCPFHETLCKK